MHDSIATPIFLASVLAWGLISLRSIFRRGRIYSSQVVAAGDSNEGDLLTTRYLRTSSRAILGFSAGFGFGGLVYGLVLAPVGDVAAAESAMTLLRLGMFAWGSFISYVVYMRIAMSFVDEARLRRAGSHYRLIYRALSHGSWRQMSSRKDLSIGTDAERRPWRFVLLVSSGLAAVLVVGLLVSGQGAMIAWAVGGVLVADAVFCVGMVLVGRD